MRGGLVPVSVATVPALIAVTQFVAVVIVYPKGERLIVPFYMLLVPYSAIGLHRLARLAARRPAVPAL
jgi:hypothetical protein